MNDYNDQIAIPISNLADILGVHQRTLRIWDKKEILTPKRTKKDRRFYTIEDIEKGKFIQFLIRNLALNITGVKIVLNLLEKQGVNFKDYKNFIQNIALEIKIDNQTQKDNIKKSLKKDRRIKYAN